MSKIMYKFLSEEEFQEWVRAVSATMNFYFFNENCEPVTYAEKPDFFKKSGFEQR